MPSLPPPSRNSCTPSRPPAFIHPHAHSNTSPNSHARIHPNPQRADYDFGPLDGDLQHNPEDNFIQTEYAAVSLDDLMVEATFTNPYDASVHNWDYGFFLRYDRGDDDPPFLQVVVDSRGRWAVKSGSGAPYNQIAAGNVSNLKLGAGQQNHLMVVALEERGWLFVNQIFVASFELSDVKVSGDVAIITGAYSGGERAGASTQYEDFRGYDLRRRYGPTSGTIERGEGFVGTHRSGFRSRDFVAEAEFSNPAGGQWDYGFLFRNPTSGHLEVSPLVAEARGPTTPAALEIVNTPNWVRAVSQTGTTVRETETNCCSSPWEILAGSSSTGNWKRP